MGQVVQFPPRLRIVESPERAGPGRTVSVKFRELRRIEGSRLAPFSPFDGDAA